MQSKREERELNPLHALCGLAPLRKGLEETSNVRARDHLHQSTDWGQKGPEKVRDLAKVTQHAEPGRGPPGASAL